MKFNKKRAIEVFLIIIFLGMVLFVTINTAEAKKLWGYAMTILKPFIFGGCTAFIVNLLVKMIDDGFAKHAAKKGEPYNIKKHRVFSIITSMLIFVAFAGLAIGLIIPNLKDTFVSLYKQAPGLWDKFVAFIDGFKTKQPKLAGLITSAENAIDNAVDKGLDSLKANASSIASGALSKIKSAGNVLINFVLGLIIAFVLILQKEEAAQECDALLQKVLQPKTYKRAKYVFSLINEKFSIYFKYNLIQAVITGAGTFIVMLITGMPYKLSITLLITVSQLIPIVGAILGTGVSALLIAAVSPIKAIIFIALSILVQQFVEKVINPHLMGKELEMPGVLTFLAIIIGGKYFGLAGLICAVPAVSIVYDIYRLKIRPRVLATYKTDKEILKLRSEIKAEEEAQKEEKKKEKKSKKNK